MRKCTKCGNKLRDGERYCTVCGAPFWMAKPSFWSTRGAKILIAALCLVAAAGIGLAAWLLLRSPENGTPEAAESRTDATQSSEAHTIQSSEAPQTLPEKTEAFIVPKGTLVKLNTGVWHLAALPVHNELLHVMIILPERTYANDCIVCQYPEDRQVEIVL